MLSKARATGLPKEHQESFRQFYFRSDVNRAKLGMLLFLMPLVTFAFNDARFLGLDVESYLVLSLRICTMLCLATAVMLISRAKNYFSYARTVTVAAFLFLVLTAIINAIRPPDFIMHVIIVSIGIFLLYLVIPLPLCNQFLLSSALTIGDAAEIVIMQSADLTALFTVLFGFILANVIAFSSAWQLQSYRLRSYLDITKLKETQEALEQYTKNLEQLVAERTEKLKEAERLAAIGATAGMVGHDIRNPLTAITGAVYIANSKLKQLPDSPTKDSVKKNLDLIGEQTLYVNKIVADLQDFARPLHPEIEETALEKVIQAVFSTLKIPEGITFEHPEEDSNLNLKTDPLYLQRILTNLSNNALQAMPNGGKLTICATQKSGRALISVSDTGEGIPQEVRNRLFTPLVTTKSRGQGFGLAVVKRLTEALGGKVTFESETEKGTTFYIELPT